MSDKVYFILPGKKGSAMKLSKQEEQEIGTYIDKLINSKESEQMKEFLQHGSITTYEHVLDVVYMSYWINKRFGITDDLHSLMIGAYLHDFYLYDWHKHGDIGGKHGWIHPMIASRNAQHRYLLNSKTKNIIESHMWPMGIRRVPKCREAVIVSIADKICATFETITRSKLLFCVNI